MQPVQRLFSCFSSVCGSIGRNCSLTRFRAREKISAQAAEYLLAQYEAPGIPVSWENIYVGEDASSLYYKGMDLDGELYGSTSNDLIFGESGNDTLYGLAGDDILYGTDRIEDTDHQGRIVFDDGREEPLFAGGLLTQTAPGATTWASADGRVTLTQGPTWTLTLNSLSVELGAAFAEGDFGITLASAATPPTVVLTATDANGSYLNDPSTAARRVDGGAGKDMVWGSPNADALYGNDGDDWMHGNGGADRIDGGAGNDVLVASSAEFLEIGSSITYRSLTRANPKSDHCLRHGA